MTTVEIVGGPRDGQRTAFLGPAFVEPYRIDGRWRRRRYELEEREDGSRYVFVSDKAEGER